MKFDHLSTILWTERELLDLLLFKAEEKQYLLLSGKSRWLPRVTHEIEIVLAQMRALEVERSAQTEELAAELGLDPEPSLRTLAQAAPTPWSDLLNEHYEALLLLVGDLRNLSDANRNIVETGMSAFSDALHAAQEPSAGTYTASGRTASETHRAVTLDGAL